MRRIFYHIWCVLFFCAWVLLCAPVAQASILDRDVAGWYSFPIKTVSLKTVSGNKGFWIGRNYRIANGALVKCQLIQGSGANGWFLQPVPEKQTDGLMGSGATYQTVSVLKFTAVLENHPLLGNTLVVQIDNNNVLTLESDLADANQLIETATTLLK